MTRPGKDRRTSAGYCLRGCRLGEAANPGPEMVRQVVGSLPGPSQNAGHDEGAMSDGHEHASQRTSDARRSATPDAARRFRHRRRAHGRSTSSRLTAALTVDASAIALARRPRQFDGYSAPCVARIPQRGNCACSWRTSAPRTVAKSSTHRPALLFLPWAAVRALPKGAGLCGLLTANLNVESADAARQCGNSVRVTLSPGTPPGRRRHRRQTTVPNKLQRTHPETRAWSREFYTTCRRTSCSVSASSPRRRCFGSQPNFARQFVH